MNRYFIVPVLVWIGLMTGCASTPVHSRVDVGMTRKQVSDAMGEPLDRTFRGKREKWAYPGATKGSQKIILFEDGRVVELLNTDAPEKVMDLASQRTDGASAEEYCEGSNRFGKFPKGGGCNLYGCWPAGGYCNGFGCSASGNCTVDGCPQPIASYKCKD